MIKSYCLFALENEFPVAKLGLRRHVCVMNIRTMCMSMCLHSKTRYTMCFAWQSFFDTCILQSSLNFACQTSEQHVFDIIVLSKSKATIRSKDKVEISVDIFIYHMQCHTVCAHTHCKCVFKCNVYKIQWKLCNASESAYWALCIYPFAIILFAPSDMQPAIIVYISLSIFMSKPRTNATVANCEIVSMRKMLYRNDLEHSSKFSNRVILMPL